VFDDDHVDVNLALAGVNPVSRSHVPRKTEHDPLGSWSFNSWDEVNYRPDIFEGEEHA
jgi:hypothetical protein